MRESAFIIHFKVQNPYEQHPEVNSGSILLDYCSALERLFALICFENPSLFFASCILAH
jgi:hypothetical protein